ncbi:ATP-binding protein [Modestobacter roseus]|uniref:Serine/threonine-protein kinase RsbW n=1 Tax=Modestobacter roseus TaxID=1181884 RepID=A0A562IQE6_9ACTN|nr:ATP-binding protein [Modestobacter roseus]MQA33201.1 ATP-binding protein [Modestobacter roseus]TWH73247.1 serine/threonine-protein kinase RsbW [Modestobacter roseus]
MVDTTGAATGERRAERLELRVPTSPTQLPAVRAMTGDLAMRMDFDLDAVEDLRLAVDEACATLAAIALGDSPLTVVFEATREHLRIDAWVPTAAGVDVPRDGFGWAVLHTLVDTVDAGPSDQATVTAGDGASTPAACITMVKKLRRYSAATLAADVLGDPVLSDASPTDHDVSVAR